MMKQYKLLLMGLLLILAGCSEEVVKLDQPIDEKPDRVIKISATVENNTPATRLAMEQDGLDLKFFWEVGDEIKLVFEAEDGLVQGTTKVTSVSADGKRGELEITVPGGSNSETFNLYGYYGGGPLSTEAGEEAIANLSVDQWGGTLPGLAQAELAMIRFAATDLDMESPDISVVFHHVGSFFKVFIENTSNTTLSDVSSVEIFSENEEDIYAHQNIGTNTVQYDVINDTFVNGTTTFLNQLQFITDGGSDDISPSEVLELWGWFPPSQQEDHVWPALKLRLNYAGGNLVTTDPKPVRTAPTAIGRAFHFIATYNGTDLAFSDVVKQKMIDPREMTQYNTVQIGSQIWMAENLKFYPFDAEIEAPSVGSDVNPHYYVYGFDGDTGDAEALEAFRVTGTLYNWAAALNGEVGSDSNPSGVGICPEGWHIPSEAEWGLLITLAGDDAGNKLKDPLWWSTGGSVGTNNFGFTARAGGARQGVEPYYFNQGESGYWLASDDVGPAQMRVVSIDNSINGIAFNNAPRENAVSIRCVKD